MKYILILIAQRVFILALLSYNMKEGETHVIWGVVRIALGLIFLWAFFDKLIGLGFATAADKSWLLGNSPTYGFLAKGVHGPLAEFYNSLASSVLVEWLFMLGLLFIGISLTFGIFMGLGCASGFVMMFLMWAALLPPANHPFIDDHVIYALVLVGLWASRAGHVIGLGRAWEKISIVRKWKLLQ